MSGSRVNKRRGERERSSVMRSSDNGQRDRRRRSRSPDNDQPRHSERDRERDSDRRRHHHHRHHHHKHHHRSHRDGDAGDNGDKKQTPTDTTSILPLPPRPLTLPFDSVPLSGRDLDAYRNTFASYLDIQKQLDIDALDEREVRGRWKSFVNKWNRGELAEGWYDPATKRRSDETAAEMAAAGVYHDAIEGQDDSDRQGEINQKPHDDSDSDYGPAPLRPPATRLIGESQRVAAGPSGATAEELMLRDELEAEQHAADRKTERLARKADRDQQRERLDELAPRAVAGTRERQLEKRAQVAASNRAFAASREGGDVEITDADLMGGGGGGGAEGADSYRQLRREQQRRKSEKELRREEQLRARQVERDRRLQGMRDKEEATMAMLQALVRERHGG